MLDVGRRHLPAGRGLTRMPYAVYRMPLPMKKRSLRSRPILDEVVHADAHVLERADLSEAFALET